MDQLIGENSKNRKEQKLIKKRGSPTSKGSIML